MKTIETKKMRPTNRGSSRISACDGDTKVIIKYDLDISDEANHRAAAIAFRSKLLWNGAMVGGQTKNGMIWVFEDTDNRIEG